MPEEGRITLLLLIIIGILCCIVGFMVVSSHQNITPGTGTGNLPKPALTNEPSGRIIDNQGSSNMSTHWFPTTDIVITESLFRQEETQTKVIAGWFKNIGHEKITTFTCDFNLTDQTGTEYVDEGYVTAGIEFLPNQTRDFQVIMTNHNNMTRINNLTCQIYK